MVEISLDIPQRIYDQLKTLSGIFSQDLEETVNEVLDAICFDIWWLTESKKVDVIPSSIRYKISDRLGLASMAEHELVGEILKELNAKSHFTASDMTIDLDDNSIWIYYVRLQGSNLFVDSFDVTFTGLKRLTADCIVNVDEDDYETLGRIEEHALRIKRTDEELPKEFRELDPWDVLVYAQDETSICFRADFSEESLDWMPSIPAISEFFEKVLKNAGVNRPL